MDMKRELFLLITAIFCMYDLEVATQNIIHILPSNHAEDSRNCLNDLDCRTLNEWIENGTSPFTNDTTVVLLPGLHLINSTRDRLVTGNDSPTDFLTVTTAFTGEQGLSIIKCLHQFSFDFINLKSVLVSNVSFTSCSLAVLYTYYNNASNSVQNNSISEGDQAIRDIVMLFITVSSKMGGTNLNSSVHILNVNFIETSMKVLCDVQELQIQELVMQRVTFERVIKSLPAVLHIQFVTQVRFANITFQNNTSPLIELVNFGYVMFEGDCIFHGNSGEWGINISKGFAFTVPSNSKIEYSNNIQHRGFLIYIEGIIKDISVINIWSSVIVMQNNTIRSGGILEIFCTAEMHIDYTNILFRKNRGLESTQPLFHEDNAIMLVIGTSIYITESVFTFLYNAAELSGGMTLVSCTLLMSGHVAFTFDFNQGKDGGAMAFYARSRMFMGPNSNIWINFYHNRALKRGGAIFVEDSDYVDSITKNMDDYIIHVPPVLDSIIIDFSNNSANLAGNQIYGGFVDLMFLNNYYGLQILKLPKNDLNPITSNPIRICICLHAVPLCNITEHRLKVYPGQTFKIEAVAVGQRMGIVPSIVLAQFNDEEGRLGEGQDVQNVGRECTVLQFTIYSSKTFKKLDLKVQQIGVPGINFYPPSSLPPYYTLLYQRLSLAIYLRKCPYGFTFHQTSKECQCLHLFNHHKGVGCYFKNGSFGLTRSKDKWMLTTFKHTSNHNIQGMLIHNHCPYGYCRRDGDSLTFHLETPDDQCAFNRSGILCGACQANLSQVLGTSRCKECSNDMLAVIIIVVFLSGIVLVAFLMLLNLTVSTGTMNGLIFYANIIRVSQAVFFPPEISGSFLSIFIAWLNLDIGMETCFYDGLDAYAKTWLQFVFPLYILLLVFSIIVASHYSSTVSRLFGNNAVQVLATLFFLSYAKILRVVITVFSFTILVYSDGFKMKVWLLDGNIEFLRGKHIPLFAVSFLVLSVLSIPYTLSLLSIQLLQKISHYRIMFWVNSLMPLFDAYTGPYKPKHRYWTGLLLVIRIILMLTFSLNYSNNPAVNLLAIAVVDFGLTTYCLYVGVYKSTFVNALEVTSLLNLGLLTAITFYQLPGKRNIDLFTNLSTSIAFILFIILILYHATKKMTILGKSLRGLQKKISLNIPILKFKLL